MNIEYNVVKEAKNIMICTLCGSLIHVDYIGKHNEWHSNVLRGSLNR